MKYDKQRSVVFCTFAWKTQKRSLW